MPDSPSTLTNSQLLAAYLAKTPSSAARYADALELFPSGVTHDVRYQEPHPIFVDRAAGPRKRDLDGNEYVDYLGGHGALLLGHCHPAVVEAVVEQVALATHPGSSHELEIRWARLIQALVPSAERLRFTSSGTEATLMALRLARAHTEKRRVIRFAGHFHGWHDHLTSRDPGNLDGAPPIGVLPEITAATLVAEPDDEDATRALIEAHDDIAALIVEPTGSYFGKTPLRPSFLRFLRRITRQKSIVLIFDEVVTGFRVSPGGAQDYFDVIPDLTTLAKVMAGGLPGGAVAGRKDLLDHLDFAAARAAQREKIHHPGTFNANPLSAAAGIATLSLIADTDSCERASAYAADLRFAMNHVLADLAIDWAVYGTFSGFHLFTNPRHRPIEPTAFDPHSVGHQELMEGDPGLLSRLRLGMLVNGVDVNGRFSGITSAVHGAAELEATEEAFRRTLQMLRNEGDIRK